MPRKNHLNLRFRKPSIGEKGFTLIELIATLVIISVLAAVLIPRYLDAETSAKMRGLDLGISEMNGRETLTWAMIKLSDNGYPGVDGDLFFGHNSWWTPAPIWALITTGLSAPRSPAGH